MNAPTAPLSLPPAMPIDGVPEWTGATWVGMLDVGAVGAGADPEVLCAPEQIDGYRRARVLLRAGLTPLEFVDVEVVDGLIRVPIPELLVPQDHSDVEQPPISVVVCTHERPEQLRVALASLRTVDYPDFEVIVVDNAPQGPATADVVEEIDDPRFRRVVEPVAGLSSARNRGLTAARHQIVAFTDDDVVADPGWLRGLARGFARDTDVACVCGMVPSGELRTRPQAYFDWRVSWADTMSTRVYSLDDPPHDLPLFPFQIGAYGTGANFAVRRETIRRLGGFDEALGAGTRTRGGEDIDMFFRVLTAGYALANEPSSIIWHRHRSDTDALLVQARGYGLGLGAWLTKVAVNRQHRRLAFSVLRRRARAVARASADYGAITKPPREFAEEMSSAVGRIEVFSVLGGPVALARERMRGRRATPLPGAST